MRPLKRCAAERNVALMIRYKTVLLFGAPGSGKGTQGKIIGAIPGFYHSACGDVFRSLDRQSPLGRTFAEYSSRGELVPDQFTIDLWRQTICDRIQNRQFDPQNQVLVLDGIPRNREQAQLLEASIEVLAIIYLVCPDIEQIVARLRRRAVLDHRPDDVREDVVRHRMEVYEEQTRPLLDYYPPHRIVQVNATRPPVDVLRGILRVLARLALPT